MINSKRKDLSLLQLRSCFICTFSVPSIKAVLLLGAISFLAYSTDYFFLSKYEVWSR